MVLKSVSGCILATAALCMTFSLPELPDAQTSNSILECIWNLHESFRDKTLISSFVLFALCVIDLRVLSRTGKKHSPGLIIVLSLIAAVWTASKALNADDTFYTLHASAGQYVKTAICILGFAFLLLLAYDAAEMFLFQAAGNKTRKGFQGFFGKYPFLLPLITITICWLPGLVISFPGYVCSDSVNHSDFPHRK